MFVLDLPEVPLQSPTILVAQSNQAGQAINAVRTAGVCQVVQNTAQIGITLVNSLSPDGIAVNYLWKFEKLNLAAHEAEAKVTFLQLPKHGKLINEVRGATIGKGGNYYSYVPDPGYYGKDKAIALVDINGYRVKVVYFLQAVQEDIGSDTWEEKYCGPKGSLWKISLPTLPADNLDIQSLTRFIGINGVVTVNIADLPGGAVGQTVGTTITLDDNAAGHNWFIDYTPWLNEEYLPTYNPYEWQAKEGTEAYGKIYF